MTQASLGHAAWPTHAACGGSVSAEQTAISELRDEIDRLDLEMLDRFERRLAIAGRIGRAKAAFSADRPCIRPDREQAVLDRIVARCMPENRDAVGALWREIVGWSMARQSRLKVKVWAPKEPSRAVDGARRRFGMAADIRIVADAESALAFAERGEGVAVLAVNDAPWWVGLRRQWSDLSVFDGIGPAGAEPTALAVGRIDIAALPAGCRVVVSAGGDAGDGGGSRRWGMATHHGWSLVLTDADLVRGDVEGCVGSIARSI